MFLMITIVPILTLPLLQVDPTTLLCISENMFVHNNSKHGRKIRRIDGTEGEFFGRLQAKFSY